MISKQQQFFNLLLIACMITSCTKISEEERMIDRGRKVFLKKCVSCHGVHAEGKAGYPSLRGATELYTDDAIHSFIRNGRGKGKKRMPPVLRISEREIQDVIAWLKQLPPEAQHNQSR